ncbi:MAG TPA: ACT domain-containing protein, partial [Thermoanaerobaculia bacterium]|nr:ACT domain-containing protein [Thermoanaerobaculia bacterium]
LLKGPARRANVELWSIPEQLTRLLSVACLKGMLTPHLSEAVNYVNAVSIAESRGIEWSATIHQTPLDYTNLITFRARSEDDEVCVSGTLFSEKNQRVVGVNQFRVEFKPEHYLLYILNRDVPGVVGKVGTILGDREINIAEYNLARSDEGGVAMAIITIDTPIDKETLAFLRSFKEVMEVRLIKL